VQSEFLVASQFCFAKDAGVRRHGETLEES
jgi:hypothetical protein